MNYRIKAVSMSLWQGRGNPDKSRQTTKPLRSFVPDDDEAKQEASNKTSRYPDSIKIPAESARSNDTKTNSHKFENPHAISDITANMLFRATLFEAD